MLRYMRQKIDTWGAREDRAQRILHYLKERKMRDLRFVGSSAKGEGYCRVMWL